MKLVSANSLEMKTINWVWNGRIPAGCITLLEGDPGCGKSTISCTLASHISTGKDWPDGEPCPQGSVILANAEDMPEEIIVPRLVAAKAELNKVSIIVPSGKEDGELFTIPDNVGTLKTTILDWNVKLVVFDPLEAFLSVKVNNYSNHHIRHALRSLENLAKEVNCAIIIVRHLNKDSGKSAMYRGGGSIGIIGAARASILVSRDPANKERCLMVPNKSNWAAIKDGLAYKTQTVDLVGTQGEAIQTSKVVWDGETSLSANDVLQPSTDLTELTDLDDASCFLRNALSDGPRFSGDVFKEGTDQGFSKKTIYRAAKMIDVLKKPEGEGKGQRWLWELQSDLTSEFLEDLAGAGIEAED
jgi:putative DNA primase/helicase